MKKTLTLLMLLLTATMCTFAQGVYQFPNSDFNNWRRTNGNGDDIPNNWHAFDDAECNLVWPLSYSCGTVKTNHNNRITGYNGGYAAEMYAKNVAGLAMANGAMSIGQTVVGSTSTNTTDNYIIGKTNYEWSFQGVPDSMSFYARQGSSQAMKGYSINKTFLYTSSTFKDVTSTATPYEGTWVGYTIFKFSVKNNQTWTRFVTEFKYSGANDLVGTSSGATLHTNYQANTDNDLLTIQRPAKLLSSFSTNETSKEGNDNEKLDIDMLRMIYDKSLSSLKIDGTDNVSLLNAYNTAEFVTHSGLTGNGTNSGHTHSNYTTAFCYSTDADFPQVSATAKSKHILSCVVTQATTTNHYAIITVTHNDNSTFTDTIFFTNAKAKPTVTIASSASTPVCPGTSVTLTASGASSYVWSNNATNNPTTVAPITQTTYSVTGTAANGCTNTASKVVEVTNAPTPNLTYTPNQTTICGTDGSTVFTASVEGKSPVYYWYVNGTQVDMTSGASSTHTETWSTPGTYVVTCDNYANSCHSAPATVTIIVKNPSAGIVSVAGTTTICSGGSGTSLTASTTGSAGTITYAWSPATGLSATSGATVTANPTTTTTYTVTATATDGPCTNTATKQVTVTVLTPNAGTVSVTPANPTICSGGSGTSLTASTTGSTGTITYAWSPATGLSATTGASVTANPTFTTTYTVTATATDGSCTNTATKQVTVTVLTPNAGTVSVTPANPTVCSGGSGTSLTASTTGSTGTITYAWSPATGLNTTSGATVTANPTNTTTYTVTATATDGSCTATATKQVTVTVLTPSAGTITVTPANPTICSGGSGTTLTASTTGNTGSVTYAWTPETGLSATSGATVTANPTNTTTYTVTATATDGSCTATATKQVTVTVLTPSAGTITVTPANPTICNGGSVNLLASVSGGVGTYSYSWSPATGLDNTQYSLVSASPTTTSTYTVNVTASLTQNDVTCTAEGTQQVTVTVNTPVAGTISVSGNTALCAGSSTSLTASSTGNVGTMSYEWTPSTGLSSTTGATVTANPTSNQTYYITATATNEVNGVSCTATASGSVYLTVTQLPAITEPANKNQTVCAGSPINAIHFICENGTASASNLPDGLTFNAATGFINGTPTESGTYTITVSSTDCGTVTATGTITVNTPAVTLQNMTMDPVCAGQTISLSATLSGTPTGDVTYSWSGPNGFTSTEQNPEIANATSVNAGSYSVTATATNVVNGVTCTATSIKNVTVTIPSPHVALQNIDNQTICAGNQLTLNAYKSGTSTGTVTYQWSGPNSFTATGNYCYRPNVTAADAGIYTVTATATISGCSVTDVKSMTLTVNAPAVALENMTAQTVCAGTTLSLSAAPSGTPSGTVTYSWSGPNSFTSAEQNPQIDNVTYLNSGNYHVIATATIGTCEVTDFKSVTITVNTASVGTISTSNQAVTICKGGQTSLSVSCYGTSGGITYAWSPADSLSSTTNNSVYAKPTTTTTYTATITATNTVNELVCTATATREFTVTVNTPAVTLQDIPAQSICAGTTLELSATPSGTTTGTVSYSWSGPNSFTSAEQNPQITNVTAVNAGTYYVTATATNEVNGVSCSVTSSKIANVQVKALPYLADPTNKNQTVCAGSPIQSISFSPGTGTLTVNNLPAGLNFNTANGYMTGTPTESGTYTVTLTNDCGTVTVSGTITVNAPAVTLENIATQTVCNGSTFNISATPAGTTTGDVTYVWSGPNGFSATEQNIQIENITSTNAGTYNVTATATVGSCTVTSSKGFSLVVNTPSVTLQNIENQTVCAGTNLHLSAGISGTPSGTVSYAWSGPGGFTYAGSDCFRNNMTIDSAGTYTVIATATQTVYGMTCTATDTKTVQVTVNAPATGTVYVTSNAPGGDNTICKGNGTTITATATGNNGDMTYAWSPATGLDATTGGQVTATPNTTTTYTVTATATVGSCTATTTQQITITVNNPVAGTVNVTGVTTICAGDNTTLTASTTGNTGDMTYAWSPATGLNTTTGTEVIATPATTATYTVTGTATVGACTAMATKQVTVTVNSLPTVTISGNTTFCQGSTETLTATEGYHNYLWSTTSTNQSIDVTSSGNYSVTVTDANGCQNNTSVTVTALPKPADPSVSTTNNTSCTSPNGSLTITSPVGSYTYSIGGDFQSAVTFNNLSAGTYMLTVKNADGCTTTAEVEVDATGNSVDAQASATTPCAGGDIQLTGNTSTTGVTYAWTGPNGFTSSQQNPTISNASSANVGTYTFTVTETATSCTKSATVTVQVNTPSVTLANIADKTVCSGADVTLNANLSGSATGTVTYAWTGPNSYTSTLQNTQINNVTTENAGVYQVVATATNEVNGVSCTATDTKSVTVTVNAPSVALNDLTDQQVCVNDNLTVYASVVGTPVGTVSYLWSGPNYSSTEQAMSLTGINTTNAGAYQVVATATNEVNGVSCTATDNKTVNVTVNELPTVTISGATTICAGTSANLTADGASNYVWSNSEETAAVTLSAAGEYSVEGTDANGCKNTATVTVAVNTPAVALNSIDDIALCENENLSLSATLNGTPTSTVTYAWSGPAEYSSTEQHSQINNVTTANSGVYQVVASVTNELNGVSCTATDTKTVNVTVNALPSEPVTQVVNNTSCATPNGTITVTSPIGIDYVYAINHGDYAASSLFDGLDAGNYTISVKNSVTGCANESTVHVSTQGSTMEVNASADAVCAGGDATLQSTVTNAAGNVAYSWSGPAGFTSADQNPQISNVSADNAGTYILQVTETATNCRVTTSAILTVNVPAPESVSAEACVSYEWRGHTYTASGDYMDTLIDNHGCMQVDTLHLTIKLPVAYSFDATACDSYTWNNQTYFESGDFVQTFTASNSCDSVVTLHLTINQTPVVTISGETAVVEGNGTTLTASGADSFEWNTEATTSSITVFPAANTIYTVVGTSNGCSSDPVSVTVIVNGCVTRTGDTSAVACDIFTWYGTDYTESTETATHLFAGVMPDGCDSLVTLHLTINHSNTGDTTATACNSFDWYEHTNITASCDNLTHTFENALGCDSVVTLHLTINHSNMGDTTAVACGSFDWYEHTNITASCDNLTHTFTNANGCDSVVTLHLTINHSNTGDTTAVACDSFDWYEHTNITASCNNLTHTFTNANGCDSVVTLHLTINHSNTGDTTAVACDRFDWYEHTNITASCDNLTHTFTNANGCDSVVTLHLTINQTPVVTISGETAVTTGNSTTLTAAGADSFEWNTGATTAAITVTPTTTTTYTVVGTSNGCSSAPVGVTVIVSECELRIGDTTAVACDAFTWYGVEYTASTETATHVFEGIMPDGCDSIVRLHLTINHSTTGDTTAVACGSFDWYEHTNITASCDNLTHTFTNASGCDSVVTLHLTINHSNTGDTTAIACESFDWYEHTNLTASCNNLTHTFTNAGGCDSVVTLHLTINHSDTGVWTAVACDSFDWYEHTNLTTSCNNLTHTFTNANGCDSVVTLHLTIIHSNTGDTTAVACDRFDWYEHTNITSSCDNLTHTFTNANGCDSVVTLHLTINQTPVVTISGETAVTTGNSTTLTAAGADSFEWNTGATTAAITVTPATTTTYTVVGTSNGCSSDPVGVTVIVGECNPVFGDTTAVACDAFTWYGVEYTASTETAIHVFEGIMPDGCDSIVRLHLTINQTPVVTVSGETTVVAGNSTTLTAAGADSFEWNTGATTAAITVTPATTTTYTVVGTSNGCSSDPVGVTVIVGECNPVFGDTTAVACDAFTWYGVEYTASTETAIHVFEGIMPDGCDSIVRLHLTINHSTTGDTTAIACNSFDWYEYTNITTSGDYTHTFTTASGCDSVVTLHLTVNPVFDTTITASICKGDSYVENGFNITPDSVGTRTYTRNLTSSMECDSIVNLVLTVNPTYYIPENATVHSNSLPFLWHGRELSESTTVYDSLTTAAGCDSIYYLTLTVTDFNIEHDDAIVLCEGNTQTWRGHDLTESGTYYDTVLTSYTIYIVDVTVKPVYNIHEDMSVCENEIPFNWHGQTISEPGNYTDSLQTGFGCDSIHTLTVQVMNVTFQEDSMTVCGEDATYAWHNMTLSETGIYSDTLRNANGCDSVVYTMNFVKGLPFYNEDTLHLEEVTLPYSWHGQSISGAGVYYDSLQTSLGCDSVYVLQVFNNEWQHVHDSIMLCPGDTAIWHEMIITESGTYTDTVFRWEDRIIYTAVVTMNEAYYYYDTVRVCQNDLPYSWHEQSVSEAGVTILRLETAAGCDSVYTLNLTVDSSYMFTETATICSNEIPYTWHGTEYNESGVYYDSLQTVAGCDSIYMLTLTVNPAIRQADTAVICEGESYTWRGRQLQTSGFYSDTVNNNYGCEDVYTLLLTVNPKSYDIVSASICLGDTYADNGFNVTPTNSGTIYDQRTLTNQYGCDSLITLVLTVNESYLFETEASTCDGTPYEWRGGEYVEEGTYFDSLVTTTGCDSVYVLYLTVNPTYEIEVIDSVRVNETYNNYGVVVTPADTGVLYYTINETTENGCDSIIRLTIIVYSPIGVQEYVTPQLRVYPNPTTAYVNIEGERMQTVYVYDMRGRLLQVQEVDTPEHTQLSFHNMANGNYIIRIRLQDGVMISRKIIKKQF